MNLNTTKLKESLQTLVHQAKSKNVVQAKAMGALLLVSILSLNALEANAQSLIPRLSATQANQATESVLTKSDRINLKTFAFAYHSDTKPMLVETYDNVLVDSQRKQSIPIKVYYPLIPKKKCPVIIFSHGGGLANKDFYEYLGREYAKNGYISIHPSHPASSSDTVIKLLKAGKTQAEIEAMIINGKSMKNQTEDVSFIIDSLPVLEKRIPSLRGNIDTQNIGLGGHSYGGRSTVALAGANVIVNNLNVIVKDSRIKAFLAISAGAVDEFAPQFGINYNTLQKTREGMLVITGTKDTTAIGVNTPPIRQLDSYTIAPSTCNKYGILVQDADHQDFAGVSFQQGGLFNALITTQNVSLAFFDAQLKGDEKAKSFMQYGLTRFLNTTGSTGFKK